MFLGTYFFFRTKLTHRSLDIQLTRWKSVRDRTWLDPEGKPEQTFDVIFENEIGGLENQADAFFSDTVEVVVGFSPTHSDNGAPALNEELFRFLNIDTWRNDLRL